MCMSRDCYPCEFSIINTPGIWHTEQMPENSLESRELLATNETAKSQG